MRCITLWQPWATLVIIGEKTLETRGSSTNYRGPLAIHAAARPPFDDLSDSSFYIRTALERHGIRVDMLPRGAVLGTVVLRDVLPVNSFTTPNLPERAFGDYSPGRYVWALRDPKPFDQPIPATGSQGFWEFERPAAPAEDVQRSLF